MRLLITAGPTREHLDSVRFLSNPSSGKMGYAIARAAVRRGHHVTLVSGPVGLDPPSGVKLIRVTSAADMMTACNQTFDSVQAAVFTAAVCDYRPVKRHRRKLPKTRGRWSLTLVATDDIAARLGRRKGTRICIAFAMEDHNARAHAQDKLLRKSCNAIVLNGPANIGGDSAHVEVLERGKQWESWVTASKLVVAARLVRLIEHLLASRPSAK